MSTILIIDDEPQNIRLIQRQFADTNYTFLTAENGAEGWNILTQYSDRISVILLDRMMPVMDGMQFLAQLKQHPEFSHIPVIMQTAAIEPSQITEGIRAGVFYYLTKPYDEELLLATVHAALRDHVARDTLQEEVQRYKRLSGLITRCDFSFRTLDEARDLAAFLANCFPEPSRVALGLSELLINAVEHGNLGISYEEKGLLNKRGVWEEEVQNRLLLPDNRNKRVFVSYETDIDTVNVTIRDEGVGFNWQPYLDIDPARASDSHGRGIAMARLISFDEIHYQGNGNIVSCLVRRQISESDAIRPTPRSESILRFRYSS